MKLLFDFFPILLFFGVFKLAESNEQTALHLVNLLVGGLISGDGIKADQAPVMLATIVAMVASVLQVSYVKLRGRKVDVMLWISFAVITIFGGLTIYFHNDVFVKWKPTIIYWLYSGAMLVAQFGFGKNMMRQAMESQIKLPDLVWKQIGMAWIAFFFVLGLINLVAAFVIFKGDTSAWVSFKTFGINGLMLAFILIQTVKLSKYIDVEEKA